MNRFYDELVHEWDMKGTKELTLEIENFNGHVRKKMDEFESVHGGNGIGEQNLEGRMLLEFGNKKDLYVANTWFKKKDRRKMTYSSGGDEIEIDFVLMEKESRKFLKDVKVISWELQHKLVVVDVKKTCLTARKRNKTYNGGYEN